MKKLVIYLLTVLMLASCEEQTDWELQPTTTGLIVVDGIITNENKVHTITIKQPVAELNEKAQPVSGATVLVSSNQLTYSFHEDEFEPGTYLSDKAFPGIKNRTYSLLITTGNKVYSSKAVLAPPALLAEFDTVRYQKNENDGLYRITWVASPFKPVKPAMYEILLNWSGTPGFEYVDPDSCKAKLFYFTLPTLDVSEIFAPASEKISFPKGTVITQRRYSLTDEHAAFYRAMLLETTWQGGLFNTASANVTTNLSEGALGFFGACGVVETTQVVK